MEQLVMVRGEGGTDEADEDEGERRAGPFATGRTTVTVRLECQREASCQKTGGVIAAQPLCRGWRRDSAQQFCLLRLALLLLLLPLAARGRPPGDASPAGGGN